MSARRNAYHSGRSHSGIAGANGRAGFSVEDEQHIVQGLKQRLGETVAIAVERVRAIPAEQSGKYRYVVSKI